MLLILVLHWRVQNLYLSPSISFYNESWISKVYLKLWYNDIRLYLLISLVLSHSSFRFCFFLLVVVVSCGMCSSTTFQCIFSSITSAVTHCVEVI